MAPSAPDRLSRRLLPSFPEAALLVLCLAVLSFQLFIPPYIGLANNGDFGKVCARFSLAPRGGWGDQFVFFAPDYEFAAKNYWKSDVPSAENVVASVPILTARSLGSSTFNIRWLGALHAAFFFAAFYALLLYLRRFGWMIQLPLAAAALWIIGDVAYVAYFNSFFADAGAIAGLLLALVFAARLATDERPRLADFVIFTLGALLFLTSKTQHGLFVLLVVAFAIVTAWRSKRTRIAGSIACALFLGCVALEFANIPPYYAGQALYNLIFFKLGPESTTKLHDLTELGLGEADMRYIGTHAFMSTSPVNDPAWTAEFLKRAGLRSLAQFYLHHPSRAFQFLSEDLHREAYQIRCLNLSNFQRKEGHEPGAITQRFASWSNFRTRLFKWWPEHIIVWYLIVIAGALATVRRGNPAARRLAAICLGIAFIAISEFCVASLVDACETYRHLLMFHVLTDVTVCFAIAWVLNRIKFAILRTSLWQN